MTIQDLTLLANLVEGRVNLLTCQALISMEVKSQRDGLEHLLWKLEAMRERIK